MAKVVPLGGLQWRIELEFDSSSGSNLSGTGTSQQTNSLNSQQNEMPTRAKELGTVSDQSEAAVVSDGVNRPRLERR